MLNCFELMKNYMSLIELNILMDGVVPGDRNLL